MTRRCRDRYESRLQVTHSATRGNLSPIVFATDKIGSCPCAYNKHHNIQVCRGMEDYYRWKWVVCFIYRRITSDNSDKDTHWIGDCLKPSGNPCAVGKGRTRYSGMKHQLSVFQSFTLITTHTETHRLPHSLNKGHY